MGVSCDGDEVWEVVGLCGVVAVGNVFEGWVVEEECDCCVEGVVPVDGVAGGEVGFGGGAEGELYL